MILRRVILALAGAAVLAAAAGVTVVALAFALYAAVEPPLGRAGASAVVAGVSALLVGAVAAGLLFASRGPKRRTMGPAGRKALERGLDFVREEPIVAIVAAVGAGVLAFRSPEYLGSALRAFLDGRPPKLK